MGQITHGAGLLLTFDLPLPVCVPAVGTLPKPVNISLTSLNFSYILKWEAGPGTPPGVYYNVEYKSERWVYLHTLTAAGVLMSPGWYPDDSLRCLQRSSDMFLAHIGSGDHEHFL